MNTSDARLLAASYDRVVKACNDLMAQGISPTHHQAYKNGYTGRFKTFNQARAIALECGDIDREKYETFRHANWKCSAGNEVYQEPDWSLLHRPLEDIEVPGLWPRKTNWRGGLWVNESKSVSTARLKQKIPRTAKQMIALERGVSQWAREKGFRFGGRRELQEVA